MRIGILGFGREGREMLRAIKRDPILRGSEITVIDQSTSISVPRSVCTMTGSEYLDRLGDFDVIFRTPGFPYLHPKLQAAKKKGATISSATVYFFAHCPATIIGITGTKGKGTTSTLLYRILKAAKRNVYLAGNIGTPAVLLLPKLKRSSFVVLELSSFQLQDLARSPRIAVVLDMFPDHQDVHASIREYFDAKSSIARFQKKDDAVFFFGDNAWSKAIARKGRGKKISVFPSKFPLLEARDVAMPGAHNFRNATMAATVACSLGVSRDTIRRVTRRFKGNEHRLELIRMLKGIRFWNDSASTNPHTTAAAVQTFHEPTILIVGGKDKNLDYAPLANALKSSSVSLVVLCGENKKKIKAQITCAKVPMCYANTYEEALRIAYQKAKKLSAHHPSVVLSPGSTSFDMFNNYAERGAIFKEFVRKLS